jgi:hypothetical protein
VTFVGLEFRDRPRRLSVGGATREEIERVVADRTLCADTLSRLLRVRDRGRYAALGDRLREYDSE